jgi:hypothetical protein
MDKPQVDRIDGIPPAIAIDQTNPVRTSRSTVGTMTELNDHVKLLFARAAGLYCRGCGGKVARDTPETIYAAIKARAQAAGDPDTGETYYLHWLAAPEQLVARKGLATRETLARYRDAWDHACERTPHGKPIELEAGDFHFRYGAGRLKVERFERARRGRRCEIDLSPLCSQTSVTSCLAMAPFTAETAMPESKVTRRPPCLSANASK